jgi:hypothetical protein
MRFRNRQAVTASHYPSQRLRRWRRVVVAALALIAVFGALTARLFVWPTQGMPSRVDAIVMLAGPGNRTALAQKLAQEHRAPVLVVSRGQHGYGGPCPPVTPGVRLACFQPDPGDTRGEAEFVGKLAERYGWHSLVLVTAREQDTRARIVMGRCFDGRIYVVAGSLPLGSWPYQLAYEWGALFKAMILYRRC